ncbi:MAG: hypothetical protein ABFS45_09740 [Pseudomonadota bacterium]
MIVQLDKKAQDLLGESELLIITERVDDVALLLGQMVGRSRCTAGKDHMMNPSKWFGGSDNRDRGDYYGDHWGEPGYGYGGPGFCITQIYI